MIGYFNEHIFEEKMLWMLYFDRNDMCECIDSI